MAVDPSSGSANASGGQFQYMGPTDTGGGGSTDYDPGAVQYQIDQIIEEYKGAGHVMPEGVVTFVMYLMQEYGLQVVGQDANIQTQVNQFFGQIHDLYNDLNNANGWSASSGGADPSIDFKNQLESLMSALTSDGFFTSGAGSSMVGQISGALSTLEGFVSAGNGAGGLEAIWAEYNNTTNTPGVSTGNPVNMNTITSTLGEVTQQYTGISKSVQAQTQSDSSQQSTEQDTMNNWLKKLNSTLLYMLQQQKTQ